jgi:hypothetical protein
VQPADLESAVVKYDAELAAMGVSLKVGRKTDGCVHGTFKEQARRHPPQLHHSTPLVQMSQTKT